MSKVMSKIFVIGCVIVVALSNRLLQQFPPSPLDCNAITCLAPSGCIDGIGCVEDDDRCDSGQSASGLFCGRGPNRVDCPDGTACNIDPTDRFAICCVDQGVEDDERCDSGQSVSGIFCGRGGVDCPDGSTCNIDPLDRFAICCVDQVDTCGGIENCLRYVVNWIA